MIVISAGLCFGTERNGRIKKIAIYGPCTQAIWAAYGLEIMGVRTNINYPFKVLWVPCEQQVSLACVTTKSNSSEATASLKLVRTADFYCELLGELNALIAMSIFSGGWNGVWLLLPAMPVLLFRSVTICSKFPAIDWGNDGALYYAHTCINFLLSDASVYWKRRSKEEQ